MSIRYETPSPVNVVTSRNSRGGGGGGGGNSLMAAYVAEMEAKQRAGAQQAELMMRDRQFADTFREGQQQFAASRDSSPAQAFAAQQQQNAQAQRIRGQMELNQAELSQSDNMRLQRLKQGEDAIKRQLSEGAITREEAQDMMTQVRTGINPLEMRKAKSQVLHQDMQNQAIQAQMKLEMERSERLGKQEEARLQFSNAQAEGKIKRIPNHAAAQQLAREWMDDFQGNPEGLKKAVEEELIARGEFKTYMIAKDGTLVEAKIQEMAPGAEGEGGTSGTGRSRSAGGGSRSAGGADFDAGRAYDQAEAAVDKLVRDGLVTPENAEAEIEKRFQARRSAFEGYRGEKESARSAGKPQPFDPKNLESGSKQQRAKVQELEHVRRNLPENITPADAAKVSKAIDESLRLVAKYSDASGSMSQAPKHVKDRMAEIDRAVNDIRGKTYPAWKPGEIPDTPENRKLWAGVGSMTPEQFAALGRAPGGAAPPAGDAPPAGGATLAGDVERLKKEQIKKRVVAPIKALDTHGRNVVDVTGRIIDNGFRYISGY